MHVAAYLLSMSHEIYPVIVATNIHFLSTATHIVVTGYHIHPLLFEHHPLLMSIL